MKVNKNNSGKYPDAITSSTGSIAPTPIELSTTTITWTAGDEPAEEVLLTLGGTAGNIQFATGVITYVQASGPVKKTPTVTISSSVIEVGGTATVSTDGPAVTLTSDDNDIATVSGTTITAVSAGSATITATWAENDEYKGGSKEFAITVNAAEVVEDGVFDFTGTHKYGTTIEPSTNGVNIDGPITWKAGNVSLTTTVFRYWNNANGNTLRIYEAGTAVISVPDGYVITSIKATGNNLGTLSTNEDNPMYINDWNGSAQSVTFNHSGSNAQIKTITVTYVEAPAPTTVTVNIPTRGWASYCSKYDVESTGQCYMATKLVNGKVTIVPVEGTIKARTGMLVKGSEGSSSVELAVAATAPEAYADMTDNKLVGVLEDTSLEGKSCYILSEGAFWPCTGGTLKAGKAYLDIAPTSAKVIDIDLNGDETAISTVNAEQQNGNIYTINGVQVKNTQLKGIYIINGKKVVK
ncbi:MAG: hypothetical protein IKH22_02085 [Prevotella sp.]|nr:hypothetical protein [Prevotella sp.]